MANRSYRAICFDLDGTLLPMELGEFMQTYFQMIGAYVARFGAAPETFAEGMKAGIKAMATHDDDRLNADVFWESYHAHVGSDDVDWMSVLAAFYDREFGTIGNAVVPSPATVRMVNTLVNKGYPLVLTTMPLFPRRAVDWRLQWAGLDPATFARITSFENSTSVKPKLSYYAENLAALGLKGEDVLMVGNNTKEDLAFSGLGADTFLVTDFLIDPINFDVRSVRNGTLEACADWVETLPACEHPATDVNPGIVGAPERERAYALNVREGAFVPPASCATEEFSITGVEG